MKTKSSIEKKKDSQLPISTESAQLSSRAFAVQAKPETDRSNTPVATGHSLQNIAFPVQAKLTIGEPNDKYEQEADRVAAQVVHRINTPKSPSANPESTTQRKSDEKLQMKQTLQRQGEPISGEASTDLESSINQAKGGGQPLDVNLQQSMGQAMGADFSGVKVHTDGQADTLNRSIQARAFTTGQDLFFKQGEYNPGSRSGQELIAHELTHVVQQTGGQANSIQRNTNTATPLDAKKTQVMNLMKGFKANSNAGMFASRGDYIETIDRWIKVALAQPDPQTTFQQVQGACQSWITKHGEVENPKEKSSVKKRRATIKGLRDAIQDYVTTANPPTQQPTPQQPTPQQPNGPEDEPEVETPKAEMLGSTSDTVANFAGIAGDIDDANASAFYNSKGGALRNLGKADRKDVHSTKDDNRTGVGDTLKTDFIDSANMAVGVSSLYQGYQKFDRKKGLHTDNVEAVSQGAQGVGQTAHGAMKLTRGIAGEIQGDKLTSGFKGTGELGGAIGDGLGLVGGVATTLSSANDMRKDWSVASGQERVVQGLNVAEKVSSTTQSGIKTGLGVYKTVMEFAGTGPWKDTVATLGSAAAIAGIVTGSIQLIQGGFQLYQGLSTNRNVVQAEKQQKPLQDEIKRQQVTIDEKVTLFDQALKQLPKDIAQEEVKLQGLDTQIASATSEQVNALRDEKKKLAAHIQNLKQLLASKQQERLALQQSLDKLKEVSTELEKQAGAMKAMKQIGSRRMADGGMKMAGGGLAVISGALVLSGVGAPIAIALGVLSGILALSYAGLSLAQSSKATDLIGIAKRLNSDGKPQGQADTKEPSYREMESRIYKCYYAHLPEVLKGTSPAGMKTRTFGDDDFTKVKHFTWEEKKKRVNEKAERLNVTSPSEASGLKEEVSSKQWIQVVDSNKKVTHKEKPKGFTKFNYKISASAHKSKQAIQASKEDIATAIVGLCAHSYDRTGKKFIDAPVNTQGGATPDEILKQHGQLTLNSLLKGADITAARWEKWLTEFSSQPQTPNGPSEANFMMKKVVDHIK
jgi:Domain of unknown function (DUF4157)